MVNYLWLKVAVAVTKLAGAASSNAVGLRGLRTALLVTAFGWACQAAGQVSGGAPTNVPGAATSNLPSGASTNLPSGKGPLLVQHIDDILVGVDPISLAVVDRDHVSGILVRVRANQPQPPLSYSHFVASCQGALKIALLRTSSSPFDLTPQGASARARVQEAAALLSGKDGGERFKPSSLRDGTRAAVQFACNASQRPAQAAQIAKELYHNAGPWDLRTALCDLQPDGTVLTREDVEVGFSDSEKVVVVNKQWFSNAEVTASEISFGTGTARWRIDRNSAEASLVDSTGKTLFAGSCIAKPMR